MHPVLAPLKLNCKKVGLHFKCLCTPYTDVVTLHNKIFKNRFKIMSYSFLTIQVVGEALLYDAVGALTDHNLPYAVCENTNHIYLHSVHSGQFTPMAKGCRHMFAMHGAYCF